MSRATVRTRQAHAPEEIIDPSVKRMWKAAARFSHLGLFFGVAIVLGLLAGRWLDQRYSRPGGHLFTLLGIVVGLVAGVRELYRAARAFQRSAAHRAVTPPAADAAPAGPATADDAPDRRGDA
jgi:hypothetical protein